MADSPDPTIPPQLKRLSLDGETGVAKHLLLSEAMLSAIRSGHWAKGDRLPTEATLAEVLPFSLGTIQRAFRELVEQGVVIRRQRSGTIVAWEGDAMHNPLHCRFLTDDGTGFVPIFPKVVSREIVRGSGPWSDHLGAPKEGVIQIDRVIDINHEFALFSRIFLDAGRCPSFLKKPLRELDTENFKLILLREFRVPVLRFTNTVQVITLPRFVTTALRLPTVIAGSLLETSATAPVDIPAYFQQIFVPPNSRTLVVSDAPAHAAPRAARRNPTSGR